MPAWRLPFPDLPLPPKGRCASAPDVELFTDTIPAEMRSRNRNTLRGVVDRGDLGRVREAGQEVVVDRLVHDHGAERGAPLAGGPEAAEERALDGEIEVGVRHDHERILAAEFQARRLEVAAAHLADAP